MDSDLSLRVESGFAEHTGSDEAYVADLDADMACRIAAGDVDAWDSFFDRYSTWAYRFAYHHLDGNRADAEDLCSDILMTSVKSIRQFDPSRDLSMSGFMAWQGTGFPGSAAAGVSSFRWFMKQPTRPPMKKTAASMRL